MKKTLFILTLTVLIACNTTQPTHKNYDKQIDSILSAFSEERWQLLPILATKAGDNRYNNILPNHLSSEYRDKLKEHYSRYKQLLLKYDKKSLSETRQMYYDVALWECDIYLESFEFAPSLVLNYDGMNFSFSYLPINQFWSTNIFMNRLATGKSMQPFNTKQDYDNWLQRLDGYLLWCDTAMSNMRKGMEMGVVLPKSLIKKVITQMQHYAKSPAEDNLFYKAVLNMPNSISKEDRMEIEKAYSEMISKKIIPKHKELAIFFEKEYLPKGLDASGIGALPNGKKLYDYLIKYFTTSNMTADEIFKLGKDEVARIKSEMELVKQKLGFKGDMSAFYEHVKNNDDLKPFTKSQDVIDNFNAIYKRMQPNLKLLFDKVPLTGFEVREVAKNEQKTGGAHYDPGAKDGSRPGIFYVSIPDAKSYNTFADEDLFLHEAIPGHHYQISLQQENSDLPGFMQMLWQSAFGEGWALYTESLGKELGLYTDLYQYFGMLSYEMHRAVRLVVDVGLHAKGWTREQAIKYCMDNEPLTHDAAAREIERYMAMPGQALSYKIGQLKILEWRKKAKNKLGDKFDIKQFHNQLLEYGCIPLSLLEKKIDKWIIDNG